MTCGVQPHWLSNGRSPHVSTSIRRKERESNPHSPEGDQLSRLAPTSRPGHPSTSQCFFRRTRTFTSNLRGAAVRKVDFAMSPEQPLALAAHPFRPNPHPCMPFPEERKLKSLPYPLPCSREDGAAGRNRTDTPLREPEFEAGGSANSPTAAKSNSLVKGPKTKNPSDWCRRGSQVRRNECLPD